MYVCVYTCRFMICCDSCEEWFHGECVGISVTEGKRMERAGKEYICPVCTERGKIEKEVRSANRSVNNIEMAHKLTFLVRTSNQDILSLIRTLFKKNPHAYYILFRMARQEKREELRETRHTSITDTKVVYTEPHM